jgi:hypothetical protein
MSEGFVASMIRRLNLRTAFLSLAGFVIVAIALVVSGRYLYNMFLGPFSIERAELLSLEKADGLFQYYVKVAGDDHADTGFTYVTTSDSGKETTEHYYHALFVDDRFLLVRTKKVEITNEEVGALVNMPTEVQKEVIAELEKDIPELNGAFLPVMLDAMDFHTSGYIGLAALFVLAVISGIGLLVAIIRFANPQAHPALKSLARYGMIETVVNQIDMEMAQPHEQVGKKVHFTRNWFVSTVNSLAAAPYRDILWCYKHITQHRTNGIPTGKTFAAYVYDRYGKNLVIAGRENDVNGILQGIAQHAPGVVAGYSDELANLYKKDRAGFASAVDQKRQGA